MRKSAVKLAAALLAAAIALPVAGSARAEDAAGPQSADDRLCELHAWPANSLRSTYHGWFHGGINDGAVQGRDGYERLPPDPLSTATQAARLRASPLAEMLSLPGYRVVVHDQALTSMQIRRPKGRIAAETPPCYAELITDDVFFQEDIVNGRFLKVLFRFRSFDGGDTPLKSFGTYSQRKLSLFPPKTPEESEASFAELADEYAGAIGEFGTALNTPPKEKSKSAKRDRK